MKNLFIAILIIPIFITINNAHAVCEEEQTQYELNACLANNLYSLTVIMEKLYTQITIDYTAETEFLEKFKASQTAWNAFMSSHIKALYPKQNKQAEYGSSYPMCVSAELAELTVYRIKQLTVWVTGLEEGEVCSGSIKFKQ